MSLKALANTVVDGEYDDTQQADGEACAPVRVPIPVGLTVVFAPPLHAVPLILRQQYARALQAHALAEETWEIVDEARDGTTEEIQAARLRFDQRRWMAGKLLPKVYGDKLLHTGADGEGPVEVKLALDRCSSGSRACSTTSGALYLGMDVPSRTPRPIRLREVNY